MTAPGCQSENKSDKKIFSLVYRSALMGTCVFQCVAPESLRSLLALNLVCLASCLHCNVRGRERGCYQLFLQPSENLRWPQAGTLFSSHTMHFRTRAPLPIICFLIINFCWCHLLLSEVLCVTHVVVQGCFYQYNQRQTDSLHPIKSSHN